MAEREPLIPPRRNEVITNGGEMTQRFAEYLEAIATITNVQQEDVDSIAPISGQVNRVSSIVSDLKLRIEDLEQGEINTGVLYSKLNVLSSLIDDIGQAMHNECIMRSKITLLEQRITDLEEQQ